MARIRSIHPGLLTDEAFMSLTVEQPLAIALYLGILMESDDLGAFEWKPMTLKARVLPAANADVAALLQVLVEHRFIAPFEAAGRKLGAVRNFCRFQRPKKPNAVHPRTAGMDAWVAREGNTSSTGMEPVPNHGDVGSEPVPNRFPTNGGNPPQMEDGGGRMEEEEESSSLRSDAPPAGAAAASASVDLPDAAIAKPKSCRSGSTKAAADVSVILEAVLSPQTAGEVIAHRKALRSPLTPGAAKALVAAFLATGDAEAAACTMMANGWRGFDPTWRGAGGGSRPRGGSGDGIEEVRRMLREGAHGQFGQGGTFGSGAGVGGADAAGGCAAPLAAADRQDGRWPGPELDLIPLRSH